MSHDSASPQACSALAGPPPATPAGREPVSGRVEDRPVVAPADGGSLADLTQPVTPLRVDALGQAAYERFMRVPNLYAVAVVDPAGQPVGILNRFRFLEAIARPFGRQLYTGRPVESFMDRSPLIVDEHVPLDVVADLLADDTTTYIFDGFIVTREDRYIGMGTGFGLMRRLTERKQATLVHMANHDVLTDLPNRQLFADRLDQAVARARASGRAAAVLYLDLDRFKAVNDGYGNAIADLLLLSVAARLTDSVRAQDTVARLGSDEFGIVLVELNDARDAERIATKLLRRCDEPHDLEGHEVNVSYSIGIAAFPDDAHDGEALLRAADDAAYHAKDVRNTWQRYHADLRRAGGTPGLAYSAVRKGIDDGRLEVVYQPIIDVRTGRVRAVEALARWRDPAHGLLSTPDLIRFAENSGLIVDLSRKVTREAMAQVAEWRRRLVPGLGLAINVSGMQFREGGLTPMIRQCVAETGLPAEWLELEITESSLMRPGAATFTTLGQLKAMGIRLSVDDFGTRYSSLSRLQRLPVDGLKIDRAFVQGIDDQGRGGEIAVAIVRMAHALGLSVTAEGVETTAQLDHLSAEGCDRAQGFLFSRPLSPGDFESYVASPARSAALGRRAGGCRMAP